MPDLEVLLTGTGGQGVILAAILLAEAAARAGLNVAQSQSYGPEARGGASKAEVIIRECAIYYPKVQNPDIVLVMSKAAYKKYGLGLSENAVLLLDNTCVQEVKPRTNLVSLPITAVTKSSLGGEQSANLTALGVVAFLAGIVPLEFVREAVQKRVPQNSVQRNLAALELGWELASQAQFGKALAPKDNITEKVGERDVT